MTSYIPRVLIILLGVGFLIFLFYSGKQAERNPCLFLQAMKNVCDQEPNQNPDLCFQAETKYMQECAPHEIHTSCYTDEVGKWQMGCP